jgi:ferredoxin-thioredoxin reductase catalytic subunit
MNDNDDDTPAPPAILPAFAPVPRLCDRSNGWKPEVQRRFIEALAETGSVKAACARVGRADHGAYNLRRHPEGASFRAAWQAAVDIAMRRLEDTMLDRAINGVEVPVFCFGNLIAYRTVHNDRLGMFMLRNRLPGRYAAGGGPKALNAVGKMAHARLKKQWRAEWEAERRRAQEEKDKEVTAGLIETFETMHRRWYAALSPCTRAAYKEFRRSERADQAAGYCPCDDEIAEAESEYDAGAASLDGRAKINMIIEVDGYAVDEVLAEPAPGDAEGDGPGEPEAPGGPRIRSAKDEGW